jgi:hypothetical protein
VSVLAAQAAGGRRSEHHAGLMGRTAHWLLRPEELLRQGGSDETAIYYGTPGFDVIVRRFVDGGGVDWF